MSNLKDAIDAYFREVDDEQFLKDVRAAGFKLIPRRSWADHLAFVLMGLVALIDRRVWSEPRLRRIPVYEYIPPEAHASGTLAAERGLIRLQKAAWYFMAPDGWRPARYI